MYWEQLEAYNKSSGILITYNERIAGMVKGSLEALNPVASELGARTPLPRI